MPPLALNLDTPVNVQIMKAGIRVAKPAYVQMMRDARLGVSDAEHSPAGMDISEGMQDARHAVEPAYFQLMHHARNSLGNVASNPAAYQIMHELKDGMHVAKTEMLYVERGDGMWGMVVVLFFMGLIIALFYTFGFFERIEAWIGVFLLMMVFVFYIDFMTGDHYTYYKTEPYQGIETNTAY